MISNITFYIIVSLWMAHTVSPCDMWWDGMFTASFLTVQWAVGADTGLGSTLAAGPGPALVVLASVLYNREFIFSIDSCCFADTHPVFTFTWVENLLRLVVSRETWSEPQTWVTSYDFWLLRDKAKSLSDTVCLVYVPRTTAWSGQVVKLWSPEKNSVCFRSSRILLLLFHPHPSQSL